MEPAGLVNWTFILIFGPKIDVVEPPVLGERVLDLARSVLAFHG